MRTKGGTESAEAPVYDWLELDNIINMKRTTNA